MSYSPPGGRRNKGNSNICAIDHFDGPQVEPCVRRRSSVTSLALAESETSDIPNEIAKKITAKLQYARNIHYYHTIPLCIVHPSPI